VTATRAVVLARGAGTRMRDVDGAAELAPDQRAAADAGHKALMPVGGRPFLDRVLAALGEAGVRDVALVVAPEHDAARAAYPDDAGPCDVRLSWVVQTEPRGTADAVLSAEGWAAGEAFLALNGDNLYPTAAIRALATLDRPGLAGFARDDLVATSNIPADRVDQFALVERDASGGLARIVEKPSADEAVRAGRTALVSMNLWRFDARIFDACRAVEPSPRGELELPAAVSLALVRGVRFAVVPCRGPVLDLSRRGDVAEVARRLSERST
jgi:glucose-1-phosphate thymidylyltransferase